jgi:predicted ABC-type ATPase
LKKVIIIAGPNGAGKTTFARNFLPKEAQTYQFINADLIAAGLSPFNPDLAAFKAGRIMLSEIEAVSLSGHPSSTVNSVFRYFCPQPLHINQSLA